jgi:hypothetical protein
MSKCPLTTVPFGAEVRNCLVLKCTKDLKLHVFVPMAGSTAGIE